MSEGPRYLTGLHVIEAFAVQNLDIPISDSPHELRHLILTGPNGSGKSTILTALRDELAKRRHRPHFTDKRKAAALEKASRNDRPYVQLRGLRNDHDPTKHVLVYLGPKRDFSPQRVSGPNAERPQAQPGKELSGLFLQHLVNRRVEQSLAREDSDDATADAIAAWFDSITDALRSLLDDPELTLELDRKSYEYRLVLGGEHPRTIEVLPDGLRSVLQIWAEIFLHHDSLEQTLGYPPPGFVLIDEVELHLHAELQEQLLPFLTRSFPTLQFIVTTHSPAVASSIANATVFDLRTHEAAPSDELRGQRYGDLFTDWFGIETDFDLETTAELEQLRELAAANPTRGSAEHQTLETLARRLADRSHLLAVQVWRELEASRD